MGFGANWGGVGATIAGTGGFFYGVKRAADELKADQRPVEWTSGRAVKHLLKRGVCTAAAAALAGWVVGAGAQQGKQFFDAKPIREAAKAHGNEVFEELKKIGMDAGQAKKAGVQATAAYKEIFSITGNADLAKTTNVIETGVQRLNAAKAAGEVGSAASKEAFKAWTPLASTGATYSDAGAPEKFKTFDAMRAGHNKQTKQGLKEFNKAVSAAGGQLVNSPDVSGTSGRDVPESRHGPQESGTDSGNALPSQLTMPDGTPIDPSDSAALSEYRKAHLEISGNVAERVASELSWDAGEVAGSRKVVESAYDTVLEFSGDPAKAAQSARNVVDYRDALIKNSRQEGQKAANTAAAALGVSAKHPEITPGMETAIVKARGDGASTYLEVADVERGYWKSLEEEVLKAARNGTS